MADLSLIMSLLQIITYAVTLVFALICSIIMMLVRRFYHLNNAFILNICLASICCNLYFIIFFAMSQFDIEHLYVERSCLVLFFAYMVCPLQVPLAFMAFSIHRLCLVVYHTNRFFRQKRWAAACIAMQWLLGFLLAVPYLFRDRPVRT